MNIIMHDINIAELAKGDKILQSPQDYLDLFGECDVDVLLVHKENIAPEFFNLSTRLAGEILQKFSNYHKRLGIIGDFAKIESKALRDFIYESNKTKQIIFVATIDEALRIFQKKP